tara:strand:+ start:752 stop:1594 length:843 start_codon:yes stop_codon:yes gene_type:complete
MRIKKKYVLLESNLIDSLNEFTEQEKRLLFVLNKEYGIPNIKTFDVWKGAAFLIELFDIPYDLAYEMSTTYFYNGHKLFGERDSLRKKQITSEIFFRHLGDMTKKFRNHMSTGTGVGDGDEVGNIKVNFEGDDLGEHKSLIENREIVMWDNNYGFTLYIPLHSSSGQWTGIYLYSKDVNPRMVVLDVRIKPIPIPRTDDNKYGWSAKGDKVRVFVTAKVGSDGDDQYVIENWMDFEVPLIKPLSKESYIKTLDVIYNDVVEKIESTNFRLPDGVEPLNLV